ncbi:hypothetical protein EAH_00051030 [Eimeria acervulina]|uniref:Uncharacterized protein n=1 Tax=Eimeria acervulina TaxID=5801 RepID=U6H0I2_EIMAC|nr:hypothetical protein EAH_00051030 [Eimeria acervulina]CDI84274.1 hypothetical protein EAH_00051030 [Eimeria acervulina]
MEVLYSSASEQTGLGVWKSVPPNADLNGSSACEKEQVSCIDELNEFGCLRVEAFRGSACSNTMGKGTAGMRQLPSFPPLQAGEQQTNRRKLAQTVSAKDEFAA